MHTASLKDPSLIGKANVNSQLTFEEFTQELFKKYNGASYNLFTENCYDLALTVCKIFGLDELAK